MSARKPSIEPPISATASSLADEALRRRPSLRVIFTTGFSRNAVIHNGVLDKDVNFLAKAFHARTTHGQGP